MKLHRITAMLWNHYYFSINSADRIFDIIFWPILDILIWGFMTFYIQNLAEFNLINVILGGIVLWVFVWRTAQDLVVYLLEHYWSRNIYHLFVTPLRSSELVISLALLGLLRAALSFTILNLLSFILYQFNIFSFNPFHLVPFVVALVITGWAVGVFISSLVIIFGSRIQVLAWSTIWIVQPFSCVFYPLASLPLWAQYIARWLPTTQVFEGLRASIQGLPFDYSNLAYALGSSTILLFLALLFLKAAMVIARKKGTFAKPE